MKRKLKLAIEDLDVESFRIPEAADEKRGTVRGNTGADFECLSYDFCTMTEPASDSWGDYTCTACQMSRGSGNWEENNMGLC